MDRISEVTTRNRVTKSNKPNNQRTTTTTTRTIRPKKQKVVRRKQSATPRKARQTKLSPCAEKYLRVLASPFSNVENVCIPDLLDMPSSKYKVKARGSLSIGTQGLGFLLASPFTVRSNDTASLYWSESAFTGNTLSVAGTGVAVGSFLQVPYALADIGNGPGLVRWRLVGMGIRVRYIGTNLNLGGRVILYRPNLFSSLDSITVDEMLSNRTTITLPTTRSWKALAYQPLLPEDMEYSSANGANWSQAIAIAVQGEPENLYEFEAVAYLEYIGAAANTTGSESDIVGMSAIRQTINKVSTVVPADDAWFGKLYDSVGGYIGTTIADPAFQQKAWTAVTSTLGSVL